MGLRARDDVLDVRLAPVLEVPAGVRAVDLAAEALDDAWLDGLRVRVIGASIGCATVLQSHDETAPGRSRNGGGGADHEHGGEGRGQRPTVWHRR